jgi:hypothetical protein
MKATFGKVGCRPSKASAVRSEKSAKSADIKFQAKSDPAQKELLIDR